MESKIESKLRLDFFLAQGLKLVGGDMPVGVDGSEYHLDASEARDWNDADSNDFHRHIKSLAPRENKGAQPVGDDVVVDAVYYDGLVETSLASVFDWSLNIGHPKYLIDTWKPNLDALIELQEKPEVTQVKPEVVGYKLIECGGTYVEYNSVRDLYSKAELTVCAANHAWFTGVKSKFRPVYKKRDTRHSK